MGVAVCLICPLVHAEPDSKDAAPTASAVIADTNSELYRMMFEGNLINANEYQHALVHGCLSGDGIVPNAAIKPERQTKWNTLYTQGVITAEELVQMLGDGTMGDLEPHEVKAFEDLAPIYEPERAKRLTYKVREKHIKVDMIRMHHRLDKQWKARYKKALSIIEKEGLQEEYLDENGEVIAQLAGVDENNMLVYLEPCTRVAADTISTDELYPGASTNSLNLDGYNQFVGMWDSGKPVTGHQELSSGRVVWKGYSGSSTKSHSTQVASIIAAKGVDSRAKGMAPAVQVYAYPSSSSLSSLPQAISEYDLRISNHSYVQSTGWPSLSYYLVGLPPWWWGDIGVCTNESIFYGRYDGVAQQLDDIIEVAHYHLPVFGAGNERSHTGGTPGKDHYTYRNGSRVVSQALHDPDGGNTGFDTVSHFQVSKNSLVVGAVRDISGGYTNASQVILENYSSCGPTDDGRIKPDLVASGDSLFTASRDYSNPGSTNYYVSYSSGTSFATPCVSGSLALLAELWEEKSPYNRPAWASTIKAIAIHTADEAGEHPGPDYRFGWGLMNTEKAASVIIDDIQWDSHPYIKEVSLKNGEEIRFGTKVANGDTLKVTICWSDPAGDIQPYTLDPTNSVLVNDIDLYVRKNLYGSPPQYTNYYPWLLDNFNPTNAAQRGINSIDNVEQVVLTNTNIYSTTYEVFVTHKGSLSNGVQDVSIILSGNTYYHPNAYPLNLDIDLAPIIWPIYPYKRVFVTTPVVVGGLYGFQKSHDLNSTNNWYSPIGEISPNDGGFSWNDPLTPTSPERTFYKIWRIQ